MALTPEELNDIRMQSSAAASAAEPSTTDQAPTGALTSSPSPSEIKGEVGTGISQGILRGLTIGGTGLTGLRAGAMAAPALGPAGPFAPAVGFVGGMTAGSMLAEKVDELFPGVSRQDLIPYREGGKTFGEALSMSPFIFGIPVMQGGRVSQFVSDMGTAARQNPLRFLIGESLSATGAGIGAGTAEAIAPGSPGARFTGEVGGSILFPGKFVTTVGGYLWDMGKGMVSGKALDAKEAKVADMLRTILAENGEDIPKVIRALEARLPKDATPSSAQKSGSSSLSMIETTLARNNPGLSAALKTQGTDTLRAYELVIENLRQIGTPDALRRAAEMRDTLHRNLLDTRLAAAERTAAEKISKIKVDNPQTRAMVGDIVKENTVRALDDARSYEKLLWNEALKDAVRIRKVKGEEVIKLRSTTPTSLGEQFLEIATSMTPERFNAKMPTEIRSIMSRLGIDADAIQRYAQGKLTREYLDTGKVPEEFLTRSAGPRTTKRESIFNSTDVQDLINIRSDLLSYARDSALNNPSFANFYGRMADSALNDLQKLNSPAYDKARSFSKQLNDYFTRTFAGDVAEGAAVVGGKVAGTTTEQKILPEILAQRAYGAGNDLTALRMNQIENAVGMMRQQYDDAVKQFGKNSAEAAALKPYADLASQRVVSVRDAHSRALLALANRAIDPATGRVNPTQLTRFVNENKIMLDRLGLTADLTNATRAENALRLVLDQNSHMNKVLRKQTAFAQVLDKENPTRVITDTINSKYPVKGFSNLVKLAKTGGTDAVEGLKSSVFDYLYQKAGGDANFSAQAFEKAFFDPVAVGKPSLYSILRGQGVYSLTEAKGLKQVLNRMGRVETAMKNNMLTDDLVKGAGAVEDLALRVMGSKLGKALEPGSLIAASAGSKYMRDMFDKTPLMAVKNIMERATTDPVFMAALLRKGSADPNKSYLGARMLNSAMINAGVNYATSDQRPTMEPTLPPYAKPLPPMRERRLLPPAPPTRGVPGMETPGQGGPAPSPTPAPGAQSTSRAMFQTLFPMDTVSNLINTPR